MLAGMAPPDRPSDDATPVEPPPLQQLPLNPQHFGTFLAVVDAGGRLSAAARELGMSQPGVTHQLNELEKRLGTRLLDRSRGRPARVTRAGRVFERYARSIVGMQSALYADLDQLSRNISGHVRLAASTGPSDSWLAPLLCSFRDQHPGVHVELQVADAAAVVDQVADSVFELGFVSGRSNHPGLQFDAVWPARIGFIAPPDHELARGALTLRDLVGARLLLSQRGSGLRAVFEHELARHDLDLTRFDIAAELGSGAAITSAVAHGHGIACVWLDGCEADIAVGRVVQLDVQGIAAEPQHYLVRRSSRRLSRRGQALVEHVRRARAARELEAVSDES